MNEKCKYILYTFVKYKNLKEHKIHTFTFVFIIKLKYRHVNLFYPV